MVKNVLNRTQKIRQQNSNPSTNSIIFARCYTAKSCHLSCRFFPDQQIPFAIDEFAKLSENLEVSSNQTLNHQLILLSVHVSSQ